MSSFLRKIIKKKEVEDGSKGASSLAVPSGVGGMQAPVGIQAMSMVLQRKFARGVQFNMKIVIRGDKNVGKTALFHRLQGLPFKEEYIPTDEIQVASIQWNYKATDDIVKVEVWDVVDKGRKKKSVDSLKLDHSTEADADNDALCLDASFVDVYKATHAVILVFDMTKQWTYSYVERELPLIPAQIPVIVVANHRDMGKHRTVDSDTVHYFIASVDRGADATPLRYAEASMLNGFGLKYLHKFFNVPYLKLQRDALLRQLEVNDLEVAAVHDELITLEESEEQNYKVFVELSERRRQEAAEQKRDGSSSSSVAMTSTQSAVVAELEVQSAVGKLSQGSAVVTLPAEQSAPLPAGVEAERVPSKASTFMSRLFSKKTDSGSTESVPAGSRLKGQSVPDTSPASATAATAAVLHVDDFVPAEDISAALDFLEDKAPAVSVPSKKALTTSSKKSNAGTAVPVQVLPKAAVPLHAESDDSDDDTLSNPMVAGFQDELDSSDDDAATAATAARRSMLANATLQLTTDEEDDAPPSPPPPSHHGAVLSPVVGGSKTATSGAGRPLVAVRHSSGSSSDEAGVFSSFAQDTALRGTKGSATSGMQFAAVQHTAITELISDSSGDESAATIVVLADEDIPGQPVSLPAKVVSVITAQDLDFLANLSSMKQVASTSAAATSVSAENAPDYRKKDGKKKKKKEDAESSDKVSKKDRTKKAKAKHFVQEAAEADDRTAPAGDEKKQKKVKAKSSDSADKGSVHMPPTGEKKEKKNTSTQRSEVDALEAFLSY